MKGYSSHNSWLDYDELIELEVKERRNYGKRYLDKRLSKTCSRYRDALYKWVSLSPNTAYTYLALADDYEDIMSRSLTESELSELYVYHDAIIVDDIDDGDSGVLMIRMPWLSGEDDV